MREREKERKGYIFKSTETKSAPLFSLLDETPSITNRRGEEKDGRKRTAQPPFFFLFFFASNPRFLPSRKRRVIPVSNHGIQYGLWRSRIRASHMQYRINLHSRGIRRSVKKINGMKKQSSRDNATAGHVSASWLPADLENQLYKLSRLMHGGGRWSRGNRNISYITWFNIVFFYWSNYYHWY